MVRVGDHGPHLSLHWWQTAASDELDEVEAAHAAVGGTGRGRRYATGQLNNAYAVLLSAQFQRFCRDLHTEAANHLSTMVPVAIRATFLYRLTEGRKLDTGNPNPGNIGSDFDRLGLKLWQDSTWSTVPNRVRRVGLEQLKGWRNAIAHQDFTKPACGGRTVVTLAEVRRWRGACSGLARAFDGFVGRHLHLTSGSPPW